LKPFSIQRKRKSKLFSTKKEKIAINPGGNTIRFESGTDTGTNGKTREQNTPGKQ
jgi:hypothetical protein